nr:HAD family phosphatase [Sciscionella marina]
MTGQELRAVLWDMDGTLVDSEKLWDIPLREIAEHYGVRLSEQQRASLVGSNMADTSAALLGFAGVAATGQRMAETSSWITERIAELFAQPLPWRPGAAEALRSVRAAGLRSALVTSTQRDTAELALNTIGPENFDVTVCGDEVDGLNKPHPEPYAKAARLLGVDPAACIAVEDSAAGSGSARAAGAVVLVVPCDAPVEPGERTELRDSLVGVDAVELTRIHATHS